LTILKIFIGMTPRPYAPVFQGLGLLVCAKNLTMLKINIGIGRCRKAVKTPNARFEKLFFSGLIFFERCDLIDKSVT